LVVLVIDSAVRTFMLPRGEAAITTRAVFVGLRGVFNRLARLTRTYEARDRIMALYAPVGLLVLPFVWLLLVMAAFTATGSSPRFVSESPIPCNVQAFSRR